MSSSSNTFNLQNKTAIITGGSSGIGLAISKLLSEKEAEVVILDVNAEAGDQAVQEISNKGGKARFLTCDVSSGEEVASTLAQIDGKEVDILINNAGIAHVGNIENTSESDLDRIYQVNIKGVYNCTRSVIPRMKQKGGVIQNVASVASLVGIADRFAYSMSKGAVLTMTYAIAKDYLEYGIRCNCIAPARVHTPFVDGFLSKNYPGEESQMFEKLSKTQPIGRMGTPQEIASLCLYLCSDEASFITGSCIPIDGGFVTLNN